MASSLVRSTIVNLVPNNDMTENAVKNPQNINRLVTKGSLLNSIQLSFEIQPKKLRNGFVIGGAESSDVKVQAACGDLFSISVMDVKESSEKDWKIRPAIRMAYSNHFRELKHNMVVSQGPLSFTMKIPDRGNDQMWYDMGIRNYFRYIYYPETLLDLPNPHSDGSVGPFRRAKCEQWGFGPKYRLDGGLNVPSTHSATRFQAPSDITKISRRIDNLKSISHVSRGTIFPQFSGSPLLIKLL